MYYIAEARQIYVPTADKSTHASQRRKKLALFGFRFTAKTPLCPQLRVVFRQNTGIVLLTVFSQSVILLHGEQQKAERY